MTVSEDKIRSPFPHVCRQGVVVSVVMCYYQKEEAVLSALERLQTQSLSMCTANEMEIILVDDGSPGPTLAERLPAEVIYLWQRKCGCGMSRARNTGAKVANGRYLVFLDPDILVCRTFMDAVLRGFHRHGDRVVQCGYVWDYFFKGSPDPRTEFGVWDNPNCVTSRFLQLAAGNFAISAELFAEAGGFDEDIIYGGVEDLTLGWTLGTRRGTGLVFNTEMESWHIPHPPGSAHRNPSRSWNVVKHKYPEFFDQYIVRGLR